MHGTHRSQGYVDPWAMLQAMRRASVAFGVDYVNQGVAGFLLGAPYRINTAVRRLVGRAVNAADVSFVNGHNLLAPVDVGRTGVEMFDGRQPCARSGVLAGGTDTGTVHDS